MWHRKNAYEAKDDSSDNLERMNKRFSADLRGQVKKIGTPVMLSKQWVTLTETLDHVAKIAGIENKSQALITMSDNSQNQQQHLTSSKKYKPKAKSTIIGGSMGAFGGALNKTPKQTKTNIYGFQQSSGSLDKPNNIGTLSASTVIKQKKNNKLTLWEKEEYIVRYMVEEGKVCVLLRQLMEFKQLVHKLNEIETYPEYTYEKYSESLNMPIEALKMKMEKYEDSAGALLRCCFASIEALQTLDMPLFFEHLQIVLKNTQSSSYKPHAIPIGYSRKQEYLIFEYLYLLTRDMEKLDEDALGNKFYELKIMDLAIEFLTKYHGALPTSAKFNAVVALSKFMELEYFATHRDKFFPTSKEQQALLNLKSEFVKELLTSYARKRALRKILELMTFYEMKLEASSNTTNKVQTNTTTNSISTSSTFQAMFASRRAFLSTAGTNTTKK